MNQALKQSTIGLFFLALGACGGATPQTATTEQAQTQAETAQLVPPGQARIGDRTRCIVNGEEFVVTETSPSAQYDGKTYYFCCPGCIDPFNADPARYINGPHAN